MRARDSSNLHQGVTLQRLDPESDGLTEEMHCFHDGRILSLE